MPYSLLAKVSKIPSRVRSWIIFGFYALLPYVFFRQLGRRCGFERLVRFGYAFRDIQVEERCSFGVGVFLNCGPDGYIRLGQNVGLNDYVYLSSLYGIEIGANTRIGEFASIRDNDHAYTDPNQPICDQGFVGKSIKIGSDVWIGRGVFIGKGIEIGDGAVIGANSVVTRSIPPYAVAVGAPARVIKNRKASISTELTNSNHNSAVHSL
jgi:acetyltransferase-like isoleucine patch superfamily enzyme